MIPVLQFGSVSIPTFFLVISLSLSALLFYLSYRTEKFQKDRTHSFNLALVLMVAGFIGGRLLHVIYEEPEYYRTNPVQILYFWQGGFVFFGGAFAAGLAAWAYCHFKNISFFNMADFFTPLLSLSHAFGRIGCVLTGCCYGQFCPAPWAVAGRYPTALIMAVGEFMFFYLLTQFERTQLIKKARAGFLFFIWVLLHCALRYFVEYWRDDFRGQFLRIPGLPPQSVSQVICIFLIALSLAGIVNFRKQKIS